MSGKTRAPSISLAIFAALVMAVTGCGTMQLYEGTARDQEEIATLVLTSAQIRLTNFDRQYSFRKLAFVKSFRLLPGSHEVEAAHADGIEFCALRFEAKAGRAYVLDTDGGYATWGAFVHELKSRDATIKLPITFDPSTDVRCKFVRK